MGIFKKEYNVAYVKKIKVKEYYKSLIKKFYVINIHTKKNLI